MTHVPSSKISKRDPGCRVSKTGVNLHEIVGIRLDDISKQGLMHEHVDKREKTQRSKESQMGGTRKVCIKHINITKMHLTINYI